MRDDAALDRRDQLLLAIVEQQADRADILDREIDLGGDLRVRIAPGAQRADGVNQFQWAVLPPRKVLDQAHHVTIFLGRSEEHTSELQSLMRISYAVFCLKKKN